MQKIRYASVVRSLMYAQVCMWPDIAYIVGVLGRYLSNPGMDHWKATKKVMRYLKKTKDHMLTYRRSDNLEIIRFFMSAKLIYVLSSFHMLFCAFYIHIHVKLIKFALNLVL